VSCSKLQRVAVCCCVLLCVVVRCSVLQCIAVYVYLHTPPQAVFRKDLRCVLQRVLQCVAVVMCISCC